MQQELTKIILGTQSRYAAFWGRHMGDPQRRLTLTKQSRLGVTRQPMRVSNRPIPVPIERLLCTPRTARFV